MTQAELAPTRTRWGIILLLWWCGIGSAMQFAKVSVGFDALGTQYQLSLPQTGWLLSMIGIVGLIFGATAGVMVRQWDYRNSLLLALAVGGLLSLGQAMLPPLSILMLSRVIEGISHLVLVIVAPILMHVFSAPQHRAIAMGLWGTFFGVAYSLASLFAAPVLAHYGVQGLLLGHGALLLALAVGVGGLMPAGA
ncbi:MFS transporter, partial [Chitinivorax sp. B]|uniref:MFS transporter n=1 Tax=Chitinivorax sp. B TaxID=2502235 RepID=UPI0014858F47